MSIFFNDESGAVTVEWVVLTSGIVGMSIGVSMVISQGINTGAQLINSNLTDGFTSSGNSENLENTLAADTETDAIETPIFISDLGSNYDDGSNGNNGNNNDESNCVKPGKGNPNKTNNGAGNCW